MFRTFFPRDFVDHTTVIFGNTIITQNEDYWYTPVYIASLKDQRLDNKFLHVLTVLNTWDVARIIRLGSVNVACSELTVKRGEELD